MADDINNIDPLGNQSGSSGRQAELDGIRKSAAQAGAEMKNLAKEFKDLQKLKGADKNFDLGLNAFKSLSQKLQGLNVDTLKSSKERKAFANQILKASQEQNANLAKISGLETQIKERLKEKATLEDDLAKKQKEARDAAANFSVKQTAVEEAAEQARIKAIELREAAEAEADGKKRARLEQQAANEYNYATKLDQEAKKLSKEAAKKAAQDQVRINSAQDLVNLTQQEVSALEGQKTSAQEIVRLQTEQIDKAGAMAKEMQAISDAAPGFIEAFEKFGQIAAQIPIIGPLINGITQDIAKSAQMFRDARAEGKNYFSAIITGAQGFLKLSFVAGLTAFVGKVFEGAKLASEAMKTLNKSVAGSTLDMSTQMSRVSAAAGKFTVPLGEAAATIAGINEALGMQLDYTQETTDQAIKLANKYGVSTDNVAKLIKLSAANKDTMTETVDAVTAGVAKFNALNNVSISTKAIFDDIASASATTLNGIGKQPGAIAAAAAAARSLGMSMEDIRSAAESTTDFQQSLTSEMQTEMMLGKQLNLNKLREAALSGDVKTQAEEMKRLIEANAGRIGNNVKLQEQFASTLGISRDQYNAMLKTQDAMSVLTGKSGAAQQENDKNRKKTNAEIAESIERSVGKMTSLADKIAKMQEGIATGAKGFFDEITDGFKGLITEDGFQWDVLWSGMKNAFDVTKKSITEGIKNIFSGDFSGTDLGKMLGAVTVASGAGYLGLKLLGSGSKFFGLDKLFGRNRPKGNASDPIHTISSGGATGDILDSLTRKLRPRNVKGLNRVKGLSNIFGGKKTIVGKQLRNLAAMFGKRSSMFKQVFNGMSKTFTSGGSKLFSGLSSTFKTGGPKILSGISNIFKGGGSKIFSGLGKIAGPALGKVLAPLELAMGAFKGVNQVKDLTAEQKKEQGIREDMGTVEAGVLGALTGNANKGSAISEFVGIEKGSGADEAMGIAASGARGAMVGAAIGSIIPGVGTAIGGAVGGAVGVIAEGFKVFSDPNSKLRQGISEFASNTWDKAKEIGNKVKEKAVEVGNKIKDFAVGVKDKALEFGAKAKEGIINFATGVKDRVAEFGAKAKEGIINFASGVKEKATAFRDAAAEKISSFASAVGNGIMSFANTARDKAKAFAGAVGEKVGAIRDKVSDFLEANGGLVNGIRAAASGLASKASEWFGSKVQGLKDWWNGDATKTVTNEIKETEIKKAVAPAVKMSADQSRKFTEALNTALAKGAEVTTKAVNQVGEILESPLGENATAANNTLNELKRLKEEGDRQHQKELIELRNQTALLYEYITKPQKSIIKMNTFRVGETLTKV